MTTIVFLNEIKILLFPNKGLFLDETRELYLLHINLAFQYIFDIAEYCGILNAIKYFNLFPRLYY